MGLLKGRFQSLRELRIQILSRKQHMWALMWIRTCIVLHNLIIHLEEGSGVNNEWRQELFEAGHEDPRPELVETDSDGTEEGDAAELRRARRHYTSPGQRFRLQLMDALFDSEYTAATRRS